MRTKHQTKILDASERLFLQKGITLTSIKDICDEIGISKGTLYYHYSSKNAIVDDLAERYITKADQALEQFAVAIMDKDIDTVMHQCINIVRYKKNSEKLHYMLFAYAVVAYPELMAVMRRRYESWIDKINAAMAYFRPNAQDNLVYSNAILAFFDGLAMRNMLGVPSVFDDQGTTLKFIKSLNLREDAKPKGQ